MPRGPALSFFLLLTLGLGLTAVSCGGDEGLEASGYVQALDPRVPAEEGDLGRFSFDQPTLLEGSSDDRTTGSCVLSADGEQWAVVVEIRRAAQIEDLGLARISIMERTDGVNGRVEADFGTVAYASSPALPCDVEIDYIEGSEGRVGLEGSCGVENGVDNASREVQVSLDLTGCSVEP